MNEIHDSTCYLVTAIVSRIILQINASKIYSTLSDDKLNITTESLNKLIVTFSEDSSSDDSYEWFDDVVESDSSEDSDDESHENNENNNDNPNNNDEKSGNNDDNNKKNEGDNNDDDDNSSDKEGNEDEDNDENDKNKNDKNNEDEENDDEEEDNDDDDEEEKYDNDEEDNENDDKKEKCSVTFNYIDLTSDDDYINIDEIDVTKKNKKDDMSMVIDTIVKPEKNHANICINNKKENKKNKKKIEKFVSKQEEKTISIKDKCEINVSVDNSTENIFKERLQKNKFACTIMNILQILKKTKQKSNIKTAIETYANGQILQSVSRYFINHDDNPINKNQIYHDSNEFFFM